MRKGRFITKLEPGSRTQQQYRDENNPNKIMKRYNASGEITGRYRDKNAGAFVDCPAVLKTFQDARDLYLRIEETFSDLPVAIRKHFNHSPEELLAAMENPARQKELIDLGVLKPDDKPVGTPDALAVSVPTGTAAAQDGK